MQTIEAKIIELAAAQVGVEPATVTPNHRFIEDLGYDSLDMVEFAMSVEDALNLSIPDNELEGIKSVGEAIALVQRYQETPHCPA